jgi:D-alanyl-lipoteichoic acid acyltransferase DltB (MBOAT superfamily)
MLTNQDISDAQYSSFRDNVPYLAILLVVHPLLRRVYNYLQPLPVRKAAPKSNGNSHISAADGDARLEQRASFDFGWAIIFLAALHGFSALKIFLILYINFNLATRLPRKYIPTATWTFNIAILFANELGGGYPFSKIARIMTPLGDEKDLLHIWGAWLDSYSGIMSRWEILFNLTVLRLISFNLDYYFSLDMNSSSVIEVSALLHSNQSPTNTPKKKQLDPSNLSERDRISTPAPQKDFSFRNYIAYALYAPLYLTGPILTFNDYISQLKYPAPSIETARTIKYGIRFLLALLCMELVLHFDYCVAISKADPNWSDYTSAQLSLLSYFNLHILWLKLLLPWRFFRLWSLIDGIDPPENMLRCVSDNPSTIKFWRGWHRSYNLWIIRYIYVPLGGSRASSFRTVVNYAAVFTFVALWHDISLNLLIWGWLIVFFMMPEVLASYIFPRKKWENSLTAYRVLCGVGVIGNLMMMLMANLVGFAVGVDGLKSIISGIFRDIDGTYSVPLSFEEAKLIQQETGFVFLVTASSALFVGIQVMFEIREAEMRKGIFLKC